MAGVHKRSMSSSESFEFLEGSGSSMSNCGEDFSESQETISVVSKEPLSYPTDTTDCEMLLHQESFSGSEEV